MLSHIYKLYLQRKIYFYINNLITINLTNEETNS